MKKVISTERKPIKMWLDNIEESALQQAKNVANLPFTFKHVSLMPDSHMGFGVPIGSILATKDVVIPFAVGADISCGMIAVKTSLNGIDRDTIKKIMGGSKKFKGGIRSKIPVGFNKHSKKQPEELMPSTPFENLHIVCANYENARKQLGTLGGNNHFWELQKGSDGHIWIMIHSGSRNLGYTVAKYYNTIAKNLNEKWCTSVPKEWNLAFLPLDTEEGQAYLAEMNYCVDYALANRSVMMNRTIECINDIIPDVYFEEPININHNFATMENHFGQNVMVHRKGATRAYKGQLGIIPGSQGTSSYIVKGKGNTESFMSCSHGAGRLMSRKKAKKVLNFDEEKKKLDDLNIIHNIRSINDLDEASGAYKDISTVMKNQEDLVDVIVELKTLAVIKG